ncbi:MAG: putative L-lactate dehydrogenase operon regulatory protein [Syntrophorhabdaceae bacterium PtaU1.Bin034]|nr:MAG: putative L-lactate dehydrogenase operon regulatory protein [Syntrophorhabdaceae bacterium PtaU1.Bin034]
MASVIFDKVSKGRYSDQVVEMIKAEVASVKYTIGDKLPTEKELTEQLNVSRTVVREAIRMLEEAGFVETKRGPKGGVFVTRAFHKPVSNSLKALVDHGELTVDDLFDVRLLIEPYIAAQAAVRAKPKDLEALQSLIDESLLHQDDTSLLKQNNINFHLALAKAAQNPVLSIIMESVIELVQQLSQDFSESSYSKAHLEIHRQILSLIEQRNADEASKLITYDITKVAKVLKDYFLTCQPGVKNRKRMKQPRARKNIQSS